jgi:amino acid adenylation domain-containing protein
VTTAAFLADLRARNIRVAADGDRLRFTGPKGALTPELQAELARRKPEILVCLRDQGSSGPPSRITPVPRTGPLPLSFGQQRLWFVQQMDPQSAAYNLPLTIPLPAVDVALLERVLSEIVRRHETLRTTFDVVDGQPLQIVGPAAAVRLPVVDLRAADAAARAAEMQRVKRDLFTAPFDLRLGPLVRFTVILLPEGAAELLIALHHIVTDGWSVALLFDELRAISLAYVRGEPSPLPEPPVQYADYAAWQRAWLTGEVLERQLSYWRTRLAGLSALELPTDRPRPAIQTVNGASQSFLLSRRLSEGLHALSRESGVTLYMTLLAAFQALLARYSGQTDIVVGTSNGNRRQVETERLIGFFVNTQVMRVDVGGDPTFADLLARVSTSALEAYDHQELPFEKLVEELHPRRDLSRSPLFDVMFILQNTPLEVFSRGTSLAGLPETGIRAADLPVQRGTAKFDLTLCTAEVGDRIGGSLEYNADLFEDATISRLLDHFERVLTEVVADPRRRLSTISLLTADDRASLARWNDTAAPIPAGCVHDLVTAQVRRTPDAIAVEGDHESLTYDALDRTSNRLARRLCEVGVGSGSLVAVCLTRTPRMVAAVLAVLKAGAAYVPLDPEYPRDRLEFMLADSHAAALVTEASIAEMLPASATPRVLLDDADGALARTSDAPLAPLATPLHPAYVIYTSGSTGRPKGVVVPHRAMVNLLATIAQAPGISADDVLLSVTTLAFDIAGLEIFLPLIAGARVVVADRADTLDGTRLKQRLARSGATLLQATPATWRMLLDAGWDGTPQVRMITGGEAIGRAFADALMERGPVLWNLYGPTETTIYSSGEQVPSDHGPITIGRPVGNTTLYILDYAGQPAPPGVKGELYIGGAGLAHGYLNRPDLTAERFLPDPFSATAGARMYRTGDLARFKADGRVDYLGRADFQIKLRGFRIELAEIEAVLSEISCVRDAVALVRTDAPAEPRLVAYLREADGMTIEVAEVRAHLRDKLPTYMVPSHFVVVADWPRTPNGKVDRKALPLPATDANVSAYLAPRSEAERKVADVWRDLLRVERVGATDNFFDLGGHSLLIVTLQGRLSAAFGREVRIVDLFRFPTVQALARHLTEDTGMSGRLGGIQDRAARSREAALRRRKMKDAGVPADEAAFGAGVGSVAAPAPPLE